mmetsp:Transcript_12538/g.19197  ORF Transcript_12538/g.19197 Transcript_12538/m.19197 type:complete len:253 (-) Transcript_12538:17-775(-)
MEETGFYHHYSKLAEEEKIVNRRKLKRLIQEVASMQANLPLSPSSSVFLRTDTNRLDIMQAMIVGPQQTPYSGGLFLFDLYCPRSYPQCAPKVHLQTTGHNTVRFNPNLYACGKVCLSLLGTWSGSGGEAWQPKVSSILQVWVSIQSLIFVDKPYFNEPGYERLIGTEQGEKESEEYNRAIRRNTVRWAMIDQLQNPKPGFEIVTKLHFKLRKKQILRELAVWKKEEKEKEGEREGGLMELVEVLEHLLDKV